MRYVAEHRFNRQSGPKLAQPPPNERRRQVLREGAAS
jgi:hypothetical protein